MRGGGGGMVRGHLRKGGQESERAARVQQLSPAGREREGKGMGE